MEIVGEILATVFTVKNIVGVFVGILVGAMLGAIPGLTSTMGIALAASFTLTWDPVTAIMILMGAYKGGIWGGSIASILIGTPGAPASAVIVEDANALTMSGKSKKALKMSMYASVTGDLFSDLCLLFLAAPVSALALKFGAPEMFALVLFALTMVATAPTPRPTNTKMRVLKGLISGFFGLFLSTIGLEQFSATNRFIFNNYNLYEGVGLVPVLIGLLSLSSIFDQICNRQKTGSIEAVYAPPPTCPEDSKVTFKEYWARMKIIIVSAIYGTGIGIIPGLGPVVGSFCGYNAGAKMTKEPETIGHGNLDVLAGAESGNSAVSGANLIPLLTLGVPGDVCAAILAGVFLIHGVAIGPGLVQKEPVMVYSIIVGLIVSNFLVLLASKIIFPIFTKVLSLPSRYLFSIVLFLCIVGAYSQSRNLFDIWVVLACAAVGFVMRKLNLSVTALVIGFILGGTAELALYQSLVISGGSLAIFLKRPIAILFFVLTIVVIIKLLRTIKAEDFDPNS